MNNKNLFVNDKELAFNIWFIVDIGTNTSKYCFLKPYSFYKSDSDQYKLDVLTQLSKTDYETCERYDFISEIQYLNENFQTGIDTTFINTIFDYNLDVFIKKMESELPKLIRYKGDYAGENLLIYQRFLLEPLFCITFLMENEYGEMQPNITDKNKEWIKNERNRIELKSKGFQN